MIQNEGIQTKSEQKKTMIIQMQANALKRERKEKRDLSILTSQQQNHTINTQVSHTSNVKT